MACTLAHPRLDARPSSVPRGWAVFIPGPRRHFGITFVLAALLPAALLPAGGCAPEAPRPASAAIRIVDDAGDTVSLAHPATRVVSLVPATTELLFAIGAGNVAVGRTTWCDYPPAASALPNLGDGISPNLEAVLARTPDLVLLYHSAKNAETAARLRALGIAAAQFNTDRLADVDRVSRLLGTLTGRRDAADSLARAFDAALRSAGPDTIVASSVAGRAHHRPSVLLLVWEQPPMTVGRGSFLSELVERAGGVNLFADIASTSATVSVEAVAARDPDLILTTAAGPGAFMDRAEWRTVRAVRERRFLRVTGSEFSRPSPRAAAAVRELATKMGAAVR